MLLFLLGACTMSHPPADTGSREACDSDSLPALPAPADATCTLTLPPDTWVVHERVLVERDDTMIWACPGADVSVIGTGNVLLLSAKATGGLSGDGNQLLVQAADSRADAAEGEAMWAAVLGAEAGACAEVRIDTSLLADPCDLP